MKKLKVKAKRSADRVADLQHATLQKKEQKVLEEKEENENEHV